MACNSCAKPFTLLRKEKGCPGCGFSYCSKCLDYKVFLPKIKAEAKVCAKCKQKKPCSSAEVQPPDAYFRRVEAMTAAPQKSTDSNKSTNLQGLDLKDQEILSRLNKLKADQKVAAVSSEQEIAERLKKIKGNLPTATDEEIHERLAKLKGVQTDKPQNPPLVLTQEFKTEQEQTNDLLKQYMEQTKIEQSYKGEFDNQLSIMEARLQKLKGFSEKAEPITNEVDSGDEEETIRKIVQKCKAEASSGIESDNASALQDNDELPFCEICNEDAKMRCVGCRYLFCKRCFLEHKDHDECNRYEPYTAPKNES